MSNIKLYCYTSYEYASVLNENAPTINRGANSDSRGIAMNKAVGSLIIAFSIITCKEFMEAS